MILILFYTYSEKSSNSWQNPINVSYFLFMWKFKLELYSELSDGIDVISNKWNNKTHYWMFTMVYCFNLFTIKTTIFTKKIQY